MLFFIVTWITSLKIISRGHLIQSQVYISFQSVNRISIEEIFSDLQTWGFLHSYVKTSCNGKYLYVL